jgi:hypothetical protein
VTSRRAHDEQLSDALTGDSALSRVLADAAGPAHEAELAGLGTARAAFTALRPSHRRFPVTSVLGRLLALKVLLVGAAAASLGGVSLAAASGSLPDGAQNAAHQLVGAPAAHGHSAGVRQDGIHRHQPSSSSSATPEASPSPSLVGLCRAYGAGVATSHGKALDNPAFTALMTAAGGKEGVDAFCAAQLAGAPGGKPTARPTHAQSHKPATHPTGSSQSHPTGKPVPHPTGRP